MLVAFRWRPKGKFREVGLQSFSLRSERQAFEEIRGNGNIGALRETHPFVRPNHGEDPARAVIAEEVLEAHIEDHGDAREGGKRGDHFPVFELRKQRGREAGVLSEIDKSDFFAQAEQTQLSSDFVRGESSLEGFGAGFLLH